MTGIPRKSGQAAGDAENTGFCRFLKYDFDDFRKQPIFTKLKFYDFIGIKKAALSELPF